MEFFVLLLDFESLLFPKAFPNILETNVCLVLPLSKLLVGEEPEACDDRDDNCESERIWINRSSNSLWSGILLFAARFLSRSSTFPSIIFALLGASIILDEEIDLSDIDIHPRAL